MNNKENEILLLTNNSIELINEINDLNIEIKYELLDILLQLDKSFISSIKYRSDFSF